MILGVGDFAIALPGLGLRKMSIDKVQNIIYNKAFPLK